MPCQYVSPSGLDSHKKRLHFRWPSEGRTARTTFGPRLGDGNFDSPALPADLLVAAGEPGLAAAFLEEVDGDLAAPAVAVTGNVGGALGVELAVEGGDALLDHGLQLVIIDVGQGDAEDVARLGDERGEEAVEEDGVEDACDTKGPKVSLARQRGHESTGGVFAFDYVAEGARVGEDVEHELGGLLLVHGPATRRTGTREG